MDSQVHLLNYVKTMQLKKVFLFPFSIVEQKDNEKYLKDVENR